MCDTAEDKYEKTANKYFGKETRSALVALSDNDQINIL
jgi:hypothetical protein